jgi:hypothetical protein
MDKEANSRQAMKRGRERGEERLFSMISLLVGLFSCLLYTHGDTCTGTETTTTTTPTTGAPSAPTTPITSPATTTTVLRCY